MSEEKKFVDANWFEPRVLYRDGVPPGVTTAMRAVKNMTALVRDAIRLLAPANLLEVGPGDAPVAEGIPGAVFLDIAPAFMKSINGIRVVADLFAAPFCDKAFDLVVASDVFTHIRPSRRYAALESFLRVGRAFLIFNPEAGTDGVADSPVPSRPILDFFSTRGFKVSERKFVVPDAAVTYTMRLITARPS
jgi:hypothetical protein